MKSSNASAGEKSTRTVLRIASVVTVLLILVSFRAAAAKRSSASSQKLSKYARIPASPFGSTR